jgi:NADH-quinone oxidoreductase subunit N
MMLPEPTALAPVVASLGAALLVVSLFHALRPRRSPSARFAWLSLTGGAYALLGLAAWLQAPGSDGLRAALLQLLATLLAAALGGLLFAGAGDSRAKQNGQAPVAVAVACMSLVGLPPTAGFHGKILIYGCLLAAGWPWLTALAVAGGAVALMPALWVLGDCRTRQVGWTSAIAIIVLVALTFLVGLYPQAGAAGVTWLADLAMAAEPRVAVTPRL